MEAFVIVGAGQAGAWIARTLRAEGYSGRLILIGEEPHWPYERPPLSKGVLRGEAHPPLLSAEDAASLGIEGWLPERVTGIDRAERRVTCASGRSVTYERLFLTTGGRARTLPGVSPGLSPRVHVLRTRDDGDRLRTAMVPGCRLAVVGGGWIGLEAAASARGLGAEVTVIEAAERLCTRTLPPVVSEYLHRLHAANGVTIVTGTGPLQISATADSVTITPGAGDPVTADLVLLGIGMSPATELAAACGLTVEDGIMVDETGRTSDPAIYAAGDNTRHPNSFAGGSLRLESWANAQNQAIAVAKAALGQSVQYDDIPWLWSDQYDASLQILGLPHRAETVIARGDPDGGKGCWLMLAADGSVAGAVAVNAARDLAGLRKMLAAAKAPDPAAWADTAIPVPKLPTVELATP